MSKSDSGYFVGTSGSKKTLTSNISDGNENHKGFSKKKEPIFSDKGHVTVKSISDRAEFFLGKSVARLEHELQKHGYETQRRPSKHSTSKAKIIMTLNGNRDLNISQIQVSPGSKRHGNVPYVKISTTDVGKIKIIGASPSEYVSDSRETAKLIFRRKRK